MRHARAILLVLFFALGGAGGFVFARLERISPPRAEAPAAERVPPKSDPSPTASAKLAGRIAAALGEIEATTTGEALQSLWESCGPDNYGEARRRLVLARWAEIDPEGGFAYFQSVDDQAGLRVFCLEWALRDASAAAEKAARNQQLGLYYALGEALASTAPERYLEFIAAWNRVSQSDSDAYQMDDAFSRLYAADPAHALALFDAVSGKGRLLALAGLAAAMARTDAAAARQWAEALDDPKERDTALGGVAYEIGKSNPAAAAAILEQLADPFADYSPGKKLLRELCGEDPAAAIAWVGEHFAPLAKSSEWVAYNLVQSLWATDEDKVISAIANTSDETLRGNLISGLKNYTNWNDIDAMLTTVDGLPSAETREALRRSLLDPLAASNARAALRYLEALPRDEATPDLWENFLEGLRGHGGLSEIAWNAIERIPVDRQARFMIGSLQQAAASDPQAALAKLESLRDHPAYPELTASVAASWARRDAAGAMTWINTLAPEMIPYAAEEFADGVGAEAAPQALVWLQSLHLSDEQLHEAASEVARTWIARDGIAASAHIRALPPGPARQGAITGLVDATYRIDAAAALEWLGEIENSSTRESFQRQITEFQARNGRRTAP